MPCMLAILATNAVDCKRNGSTLPANLHLAVLAKVIPATAASSVHGHQPRKNHTATGQIAHFLSCGMSGLFIVDLDFVVDDTADALRRSGIDGVIQAGRSSIEGKRIYVCSPDGHRPRHPAPADFSPR